MKPLVVLITVFVLSLLSIKIFRGDYEFALSARIAMSAMLMFAAIGHFVYTQGMSMMLPDFIPCKREVIYLSGILEMAAAVGLLIPKFQTETAWFLIAFLILALPANIYASMNQIDYQKGTFDGPGSTYLWFRIPLQIFFIVWVYLSSIK